MTVQENLLVAADRNERLRYLTDLVRPGATRTSEVVEDVISEFHLGDHLAQRPSSLSQGSARLVGIARALVTEPSVVLLDEPAAGLDGPETAEVATAITRVAHEQRLGVLLVEHDVDLLMSCCDRIVVLDFGRVIAQGTPDEIAHHEGVSRAYLGVEAGPSLTPDAHHPLLEGSA
jgi:ABC-type branched-subunit amino acid transport system ATPase component